MLNVDPDGRPDIDKVSCPSLPNESIRRDTNKFEFLRCRSLSSRTVSWLRCGDPEDNHIDRLNGVRIRPTQETPVLKGMNLRGFALEALIDLKRKAYASHAQCIATSRPDSCLVALTTISPCSQSTKRPRPYRILSIGCTVGYRMKSLLTKSLAMLCS
jgi:hypothetical protein